MTPARAARVAISGAASLARFAASAVAVGVVLIAAAATALAAQPAADSRPARRSGFDFMTLQTQAMQRDDASNPAMLAVADGESIWLQKSGAAKISCADCHGQASTSMRGVAARYPAFDDKSQRPLTLSQRIDQCRVDHQQAPPFTAESAPLLAIESYVGLQSRGLPIAPPADVRLQPFVDRGERRFMQRIGQLDLSCAQCHDDHAGQHLGGSVIPQAHPTGYPIYRLEWQGVGSIERRLRGCMSGVRAEAFPYGAPELVELQLYLARRAAGMAIETPGVRP